MELVDPNTNRAIILDTFRGRLAGWLGNTRILNVIFTQRILTPGDVAMMRKHSDQITLRGMARVIERILDNRIVRRTLISYEMKRTRMSKANVKADVDGYLMWAKELLRPGRAGIVTFN